MRGREWDRRTENKNKKEEQKEKEKKDFLWDAASVLAFPFLVALPTGFGLA